ncbi:MAG: F0F1 ATP synthase subunit epsilon [Salaquimonas sp.]|jgi:F-type H+-transporting ATPase subunit epsilon|nr:F0F1 ATP synthase subunit epsilon [Salaquimonas sp.]
MADSFKFELVSPERLLVSEDVESVVVPGSDGEMTVMAYHAPVMSTLKPGIVTTTKTGGQTERYVVYGGFADILPDGCTLLAESATTVSEVDPNDVTQRIQNAREDVTDAKDAETKADAEAMLSHLELLEKAISMSR